MLRADDLILQHGSRPYDPQKRHEYYIRTRQLKGKQRAAPPSPSARPSTGGRPDTNQGSSSSPGPKGHGGRPQHHEGPSNQEKVKALQQRLSSLQVVLYELVRQAKMRSGVEVKPKSESPSTSTTTESKTKSSSSKKDTPDKPKTAAEKRDDAKRQKEYREKQQREHPKPAQQVENLHKQIADTKDRIQKMRKTLASARNRSGPKVESAGSVGASLPKTK